MPLVIAFTSCSLPSSLMLMSRFFDCRRRFCQNLQHPYVLV